tara:strand:- start:2209 stop:2580 length:372 start_codon:yes stop_codon:yes gene_type:complete
MAHTGVFATSDEIKFKAGSGVSAAAATEANINQLAKEVEAFCNDLTRYNFSANFASLNTTVTGLLTEIETNYCGYFLIAYDNSGYNSQREAENLMNTCWARFIQCIGLLKNQETVTYMKGVAA